ncbi:MAG: TetR family transcriptional regulator [Giesbergeria sp.]
MARRTKAEAQITRGSLLDAAELLFDERGVSRTSLADIAKAAGTTRGAIYWHFADKAALFDAMIERATGALTPDLPGEDATINIAQMCCGLVAALEGIARHPHLRRVMRIAIHRVEYVGELDAIRARHLSTHRAWTARSERALALAFATEPQPPPMTSTLAAIGLHSLVEGLLQGWLLDPDAFDLAETGRAILANWLRGLGLDDAACAAPH